MKNLNAIFKNLKGVDGALITSEPGTFYLSGYINDAAFILLTKDSALYFTDSRYTLLTKREEIDRIADECTMGFQKNIDTLHGAPALVVLTTVNDRSGYERDGSFSTSKGTHWQSFDAGLAAEAFCVAAHDAGLGTVILGIYDEAKVKAVLNLPETESVSALIPIGVPAESPAAPKRKDVSELLRIR